jgi:hypothetical protein
MIKNNLYVYNKLREFHKNTILPLLKIEMSNGKMNAIETLHGLLYMAEGEFSLDESLKSGGKIEW